jgi:hypothetical protein
MGAAPGNDACASATPIGVGTFNATNTGATADGADSCRGGTNLDVYYTIHADCSGNLVLDTCMSALDTVISVHSGCPATTANQIGCNDDHAGAGPCPETLASYLSVPVTAGTDYIVRVAGFASQTGAFTLTAAFETGGTPVNDACAAAAPITAGAYTGATCSATADGAAISCGLNVATTPDVWYSYTAPCSGSLVLDTCGSSFDTVVGVYTGSCAGLTEVGCNDDGGVCPTNELASHLSVAVEAGTTYLVRVGGYNGDTGDFTLTVTSPSPANDACASAVAIGNGTTAFDTTCSTRDGTDTCRPTATAGDVWYSYTATCTGNFVLDTCGSSYDTDISVYSGACGNLTEIGCNDDNGGAGPCPGGLTSYLSVPVTPGTTYLVRVSGFAGLTGVGTLHTSCAPTCVADMNGDGQVNVQDFLLFLQLFSAGDSRADVNGTGDINVQDYLAYLQLYSAGC